MYGLGDLGDVKRGSSEWKSLRKSSGVLAEVFLDTFGHFWEVLEVGWVKIEPPPQKFLRRFSGGRVRNCITTFLVFLDLF